MRAVLALAAALILAVAARPAAAEDDALIAVATNFLPVAEALEPVFAAGTGQRIRLAGGSTGKLAAQILNGAPYDAFLAADAERPALLEAEGLAVPESRFTYATGRLALWSADPARVGPDGARTLAKADFRRLAMANPELAPYGAAAAETLAALGLADALAPKIVLGENVGQAQALVATGNAELGFVALSGIDGPRAPAGGSRWLVPEELHAPIRQDAVLLARAPPDGAAAAFLDFLKTGPAREIIAAHGYAVD